MLKISKQADYALILLSVLARRPFGASLSARELAESSRVAAPMVAKVLKGLGRAGLLASQRGANGGYALARPAIDITVLEVLEAVEGPVALTECATSEGQRAGCEVGCPTKSPWQRINEAIREALSRVSLAEMTCPIGDPVGAFAGASRPILPTESEDHE